MAGAAPLVLIPCARLRHTRGVLAKNRIKIVTRQSRRARNVIWPFLVLRYASAIVEVRGAYSFMRIVATLSAVGLALLTTAPLANAQSQADDPE